MLVHSRHQYMRSADSRNQNRTMENKTSDKIISVLIVDDHPTVRRGLASFINTMEGYSCVGEASNGGEAVRVAAELKPDIVLMDLVMPEMDGATATQQILQNVQGVRVLVLTSFHEQHLVQNALKAGAVGYILKTASVDELTTAIRMAYKGETVLSPEATQALVRASRASSIGDNLTEREREILQLLAQGLSNSEIAGKLFVTVPTVKFHVTNVLSKLQVGSRTEAVLLALKYKLVKDVT
jgi:two-component system, NarL family, response regulator LiaR